MSGNHVAGQGDKGQVRHVKGGLGPPLSDPAVLRQAEGDVVASAVAIRLEPAARAELDRRARIAAFAPDAEAQMLALADRADVPKLAAGREQRDLGIAETERRELCELGAE